MHTHTPEELFIFGMQRGQAAETHIEGECGEILSLIVIGLDLIVCVCG